MRYYDIDAQLTRLRMLEDGWDSAWPHGHGIPYEGPQE